MKAIILVAIFQIALADVFPAEPPASNVPIAPIPVNFLPSSPSLLGSILPPYQVIGTPQDQIQLSEYPVENLNHLLLTDDVTAPKTELVLPEIHMAKPYSHYSEHNYENMLRFLQQLRDLKEKLPESEDSSLVDVVPVPFGVYGPPELQPKEFVTPIVVPEYKAPPPPPSVPIYEAPAPVAKYEAPAPVEKYEAPAPVAKYEAPPPLPKYEAPAPVEKYEAPAPVGKYEAPVSVVNYEAPPPLPKYEAPALLPKYEAPAPLPKYEAPRPLPKYEAPPPLPVYRPAQPASEYGPPPPVSAYARPALEYGVPPPSEGLNLLDVHILPGAPTGQELLPGSLGVIPSSSTPNEQVLKLPGNTQVNIIDDKNQYSHGFSQPDGTAVSEQGTLISTDNGWEYVIAKTGFYEYVSPDGTPIRVDYIADDKGYRATLSHPGEK